MNGWGWVAFGLGIFDTLVIVLVVVAARRLYRRVRPQVEPYLSLVAGMFGQATGTDDAGSPSPVAAPAATPDRCEYDDHAWSAPMPSADGDMHYCLRCGYVEPLPGS